MSIRLEWMHADHIVINGLIPGETAADRQDLDLDSENIALQLLEDEGAVIVGDRQSLINLGQRIIEMAIYTDDRYENMERKQELDDSLALLQSKNGGKLLEELEATKSALDNALALLGMER